MKKLVLLALVLLAYPAYAKPAKHTSAYVRKQMIVENIDRYLELIHFPQMIEVVSVDTRKNRIFAGANDDILDLLKDKRIWTKDIFVAHWSHKDAVKSWRYKKNPSIQFTELVRGNGQQLFEIDIDRWLPQWSGPWSTFRHLAVESLVHKVTRGATNQGRMSHVLDKWEARNRKLATVTK